MKVIVACVAVMGSAPSISACQIVTHQNVDVSSYERINERRLEGILRGSRMHDPECETPDGCDDIFLSENRLRRSTASNGWTDGTYRVVGDRYCTSVSGSRQCFELWEAYGTGSPWVRVAVGAGLSSGRVVHLIPDDGRQHSTINLAPETNR